MKEINQELNETAVDIDTVTGAPLHNYPPAKVVCQLDDYGYYTGQAVADLSPLEADQGIYLLPAGCVDTGPPEEQPGMAAWWDADAETWQHHPDHRGQTVYRTDDGSPLVIDRPGDYPPGTTVHPRPSGYHTFDVAGGNWVLTDEAAAQQAADAAAVLRERAAAEVVYAATIIAALQDEIELDEDGDTAVAEAQLADWRRYRVVCLKVQRGQLDALPARPA